MIKKISENTVKLCCGGNCPSVSFENDVIVIRDDFGGEVKLSKAEASEVSEAAKQVCD